MNSVYLWDSATRYKQKTEIFLVTRHQLAENLILVFGFYEGQIKDKSEFVTKVVGIIVTIFV